MSTTDQYLDARARFVNAESEVKTLTTTIQNIASAMERSPESFSFVEGEEAAVKRPGSGITVSARVWKSAEEIMAVLSEYRAARAACASAWNAVPADRQAGLQVPPGAVTSVARRVGGSSY